jgi:hypothetical protein
MRQLVKVASQPRGQQFVIGGYILNGNALDSILVGYFESRDFMYAGSVRAGIPSEFRPVLVPHFEKLRITRCPFANLPQRTEVWWGEGLSAENGAMPLPVSRRRRPNRVFGMDTREWLASPTFHPDFAPIRTPPT